MILILKKSNRKSRPENERVSARAQENLVAKCEFRVIAMHILKHFFFSCKKADDKRDRLVFAPVFLFASKKKINKKIPDNVIILYPTHEPHNSKIKIKQIKNEPDLIP